MVNYSYLPNSDLISTLTSDLCSLTSTRSYEDHRNLLTQVKNAIDTNTVSQYDYVNDNGGRRTSVKHSGTAFDAGAAFNQYGYNMRSEVTNANRYWGADLGETGDPVDGQAFAYAYDNIGNRSGSERGDEAMSYTANNLNQYTERTIPDGLDVLGTAETNSTVTVNNLATTRFGKYWYRGLTVSNASAAVWKEINVVGVYNPPGTNDPDIVTVESGAVFVAKTPEAFTYDDDGNLLSDGRFNYSWDAENRLIGAETLTNLSASVPLVKVEFAYDYMARRVDKTVSTWDGTNWVGQSTNRFVYDGWNLIRDMQTTSSGLQTNLYVWANLAGAGGGILSTVLQTTNGLQPIAYYYDGNGNISELIGTNGEIVAHYEYSPFGETIVATGPLAKENKFRFSTKYFMDELSIGDWGKRYYHPDDGRWLSRDQIGEAGGINLFAFTQNNPISRLDSIGHTWKAGRKGNDYFRKYNDQPIARDENGTWLPPMTKYKGGGTYPSSTYKVIDPIYEERSPLCWCVKEETGIADMHYEWWGVRAGTPSDVMLQSIKMPEVTAAFGTWHEETEVGLLKKLYGNTLEIAENRAKEKSCSGRLAPLTRKDLVEYVKWDKAKQTYEALLNVGGSDAAPFDVKFSITIRDGTFVALEDMNTYSESLFPEYEASIY